MSGLKSDRYGASAKEKMVAWRGERREIAVKLLMSMPGAMPWPRSQRRLPVYKTVGSDEFLTVRTQMLNRYRESKSMNSHAPVRARHGLTAEELFRGWLSASLPKKFGVTKGSIVAPSVGLSYELREHDIIVYDKQNAVILWGHDDGDVTRGISAEDVLAVLEVKATLTKKHAKGALEKLSEVNQFVSVNSESGEIISKLNRRFHCYTVFFELLKADRNKSAILDSLLPEGAIFNYAGGIVLSAEDDSTNCSGKIELLDDSTLPEYPKAPLFKNPEKLHFRAKPDESRIEIPPQGSLNMRTMPYNDPSNQSRQVPEESKAVSHRRWYYEKAYCVFSRGIKVGEGQYLMASLSWSKSMFSRFVFELKARLEGVHVGGRAVTDHGLFFHGTL
ncbi:MAG: DUF6602 domain-containing protein [Pseudomonadota bacterium]